MGPEELTRELNEGKTKVRSRKQRLNELVLKELSKDIAEIHEKSKITFFKGIVFGALISFLGGGITASFFNFKDSLSLWDFFIGSAYTGVLLFLIYLLSRDIQDPEVI